VGDPLAVDRERRPEPSGRLAPARRAAGRGGAARSRLERGEHHAPLGDARVELEPSRPAGRRRLRRRLRIWLIASRSRARGAAARLVEQRTARRRRAEALGGERRARSPGRAAAQARERARDASAAGSASASRKVTLLRQLPPSTRRALSVAARSVRPRRSGRASRRSISTPSARSSACRWRLGQLERLLAAAPRPARAGRIVLAAGEPVGLDPAAPKRSASAARGSAASSPSVAIPSRSSVDQRRGAARASAAARPAAAPGTRGRCRGRSACAAVGSASAAASAQKRVGAAARRAGRSSARRAAASTSSSEPPWRPRSPSSAKQASPGRADSTPAPICSSVRSVCSQAAADRERIGAHELERRAARERFAERHAAAHAKGLGGSGDLADRPAPPASRRGDRECPAGERLEVPPAATTSSKRGIRTQAIIRTDVRMPGKRAQASIHAFNAPLRRRISDTERSYVEPGHDLQAASAHVRRVDQRSALSQA
jgi:hypothetical protein